MEDVNKTNAKFQFLGYTVLESHIHRSSDHNKKCLKYSIKPSACADGNDLKLTLDIIVEEEGSRDSFNANIVIVGDFKLSNEIDIESDKFNFFFINAPAILFPYVRAYISALTALSGMPAIILPTVNMANLKNKLKENTSFKKLNK